MGDRAARHKCTSDAPTVVIFAEVQVRWNLGARYVSAQKVEDPELQLMRPVEPLAPVFAVMGFIGGMWADDLCAGIGSGLQRCDPYGDLRWLVPNQRLDWAGKLIAGGIAALALWIAGAFCARHLTRGGGLLAVTAISVSTCTLTGMLAAMATLVFGDAEPGRIMTLGTTAGLTSAPACAVAAHLSYQAWCARPGTIGHRLYRRGMWLAVAGYVVLIDARFAQLGFARYGLAALDLSRFNDLSIWHQRDILGASLLVAATAVGMIIGALSLVQLSRLGSLRQLLTTKPKRGPQGDVKHFDLGIGQEELRCVARGTNPYRDTDHLVASCRGDFRRLGRSLRWAAAGASAVVLIALLTLVFRNVSLTCY